MKTITVKIHNSKWKIKHVDKIDFEDRNPAGLTDRVDKTILVNKSFDSELRNTIIHELVHAFIIEYGFYQVEMDSENLAEFIAAYLDDIYLITNKIEKKFNS